VKVAFSPKLFLGNEPMAFPFVPKKGKAYTQARFNAMSIQTRKLYDSANGDSWYLVHDPADARVFVRHEANVASGGAISDIDIGTFLSRGGHGPEKQELLRLIGALVDSPPQIIERL
jgi:hypothetical protein